METSVEDASTQTTAAYVPSFVRGSNVVQSGKERRDNQAQTTTVAVVHAFVQTITDSSSLKASTVVEPLKPDVQDRTTQTDAAPLEQQRTGLLGPETRVSSASSLSSPIAVQRQNYLPAVEPAYIPSPELSEAITNDERQSSNQDPSVSLSATSAIRTRARSMPADISGIDAGDDDAPVRSFSPHYAAHGSPPPQQPRRLPPIKKKKKRVRQRSNTSSMATPKTQKEAPKWKPWQILPKEFSTVQLD